jgi:hypothetical protein
MSASSQDGEHATKRRPSKAMPRTDDVDVIKISGAKSRTRERIRRAAFQQAGQMALRTRP